jgi:hypothetical protein
MRNSFDVALSYASGERDYVQRVFEHLKEVGLAVFCSGFRERHTPNARITTPSSQVLRPSLP